MHAVCQKYHSLGYDAYCPNLLGRSEYFPYDRQDIAYAHFIKHEDLTGTALLQTCVKAYAENISKFFYWGSA